MADGQSAFWSRVADKYDRVVDLQIGPNTRSMVRDRVAKEGSLGELAELGCGTGFFTQVLAGKATKVIATDLSPGMLAIARERVRAWNVTFREEDCQRTSLPDAAFDTAFMSLVIHFTEAAKALAEMRRILRPDGTLIIANLDPGALSGLDRVRCLARVLYRGFSGYRVKPPKGFGSGVMTEPELRDRLRESGFEVVSSETIKDPSLSSSIPIDYFRARRV